MLAKKANAAISHIQNMDRLRFQTRTQRSIASERKFLGPLWTLRKSIDMGNKNITAHTTSIGYVLKTQSSSAWNVASQGAPRKAPGGAESGKLRCLRRSPVTSSIVIAHFSVRKSLYRCHSTYDTRLTCPRATRYSVQCCPSYYTSRNLI